jgi:dTDP-4-amino-4,6-dideoxygalactose transaminase
MYVVGQEEIDALTRVIETKALFRYGIGGECARFEERYARFLGVKHFALAASGSNALAAAMMAVGLGPGDEVLIPAHTYMATATSVLAVGAIPVIVDVDESITISPKAVEAAIGPRTRAVVPVHMWGAAADMDAIMDIARRHGLKVVEDAAHAIPTHWHGRRIGSIGDITVFSFYATKNLTTGEGGMITTDDDAFAERMRLMCLHGMSRDAWKRYTQAGSWSYEILAPGFKYNLTDIAAAMGMPQLRHSGTYHARRAEIARRYDAAIAKLPGLKAPTTRDHQEHGWHLYVIQVQPEHLSIDRDEFIRQMVALNIGVSVHFIPLHLHPYWRDRYGWTPADLPNASAVFQRILSLPIYAKMSDRDIQDVIDAVTWIATRYRK